MAFATIQWVVSFATFVVVMSIVIWSVVYLAKKHSGRKDRAEVQQMVIPGVKFENLEKVCKTLINSMGIISTSINSMTSAVTANYTKYSVTSSPTSRATVYSTMVHSTVSKMGNTSLQSNVTRVPVKTSSPAHPRPTHKSTLKTRASTAENISSQTYVTRASIKTSPIHPLPTHKSTRVSRPTEESKKRTTSKSEMSSISAIVSGNSSVIRRAINNTFIQKPADNVTEEIENNPNIEFGDPDVSVGVRNHTDSWNVLASDFDKNTEVYQTEKSMRNVHEKDADQKKILEKHSIKILTDEPRFQVIPMKEEELLPDTIIPAFPLDFVHELSNSVAGRNKTLNMPSSFFPFLDRYKWRP